MQTNWYSLIATLLGAVNTALLTFDAYHLNNEQLDALLKLVSVVVTIVGIVMTHRKPPDIIFPPSEPPEQTKTPTKA